MTEILKKYDFFHIYKHSKTKKSEGRFDKAGNDYDLSVLDELLKKRFLANPMTLNPVKLDQHSYAGITNIRFYDAEGHVLSRKDEPDLGISHFWVFNIERADTLKKAVVVQVERDIQSGRREYGDSAEEGAASDTVVCFNPANGVVVLPPRSGMGISKLEQYFYKISRQQGLVDDVVVDKTSAENLEHISEISEINFRVTNVVTDDRSIKNAGLAKYNEINNKKMTMRWYGGNIKVHEAVALIKSLLKMNNEKKLSLEKMLVDGRENEDAQLIDLINQRMIASNNVQVVNGKIPMDAMMDSVKDAYLSNKIKLDNSHRAKGGKGV